MEGTENIPEAEKIISDLDSLYDSAIDSICVYNKLVSKYPIEKKEDLLQLLRPIVDLFQHIDANFALLSLGYPEEYEKLSTFKHDLAHYMSPLELRIGIMNSNHFNFTPGTEDKITLPLNKLKDFLLMNKPEGLSLLQVPTISLIRTIQSFKDRIEGLPEMDIKDNGMNSMLLTNLPGIDSVLFNLLINTTNPNVQISRVVISTEVDPNSPTHLIINIQDNGYGIRPSRLLPKNTSNFEGGGQGLGIPSAINLISSMQGHYINIDSILASNRRMEFGVLLGVLDNIKPDDTSQRVRNRNEYGTQFSIGIPMI